MVWLFVPGLADSSLGSDSPSENPTQLWVTSSGTPTQRRLSWRGWKTRLWISRLSGTISQPSTASDGAARWISSLPVSRVSQRAQRDSEKAEPTTAGSGPGSLGSFATWDRGMSSWRTSEGCFQWMTATPLARYSETWPGSGSMQSGACFKRQTAAHPIVESGSSRWHTPTARDWKGYTQRSGESICNQLRELRGGTGVPNPDWIDWLMGLPTGWTGCEPLEMGSFLRWLALHGRPFGQGLQAFSRHRDAKSLGHYTKARPTMATIRKITGGDDA